MDAYLELYGDLSQIFQLTDKEADKLWSLINKFKISKKQNINNIPFNDAVNKFVEIKQLENLSKHTLKYYKCYPLEFYKFVQKDLNEITRDDFNNYIKYLESHNKKNSIYIKIKTLTRFFEFCFNENLIKENPCATLNYKNTQINRTYIRDDELEKIKLNCKTDFEILIFEFLLCTGCRVSEVSKIKVDDINFKDNTVYVTGKGNKSRFVLINNKTNKLLKSYIKNYSINNYVFCLNDEIVTQSIIAKTIKRISKNVNNKISTHMFRHTFATKCLNDGMDISMISKLLGHDNLSTTQVYAKMNVNNIKTKYNEVFNGKTL